MVQTNLATTLSRTHSAIIQLNSRIPLLTKHFHLTKDPISHAVNCKIMFTWNVEITNQAQISWTAAKNHLRVKRSTNVCSRVELGATIKTTQRDTTPIITRQALASRHQRAGQATCRRPSQTRAKTSKKQMYTLISWAESMLRNWARISPPIPLPLSHRCHQVFMRRALSFRRSQIRVL